MSNKEAKYKAHYPNGDTKVFKYNEKPCLEHLYEIIGTDIVEPMARNYKVWWVDEEARFKKGVEENPYMGCLGIAVELVECEFE